MRKLKKSELKRVYGAGTHVSESAASATSGPSAASATSGPSVSAT